MSKIRAIRDKNGVITGYGASGIQALRYERKHKNDKTPASVSLIKMCENIGHPEYFVQIRNRILRDPFARQGVMFNIRDSTDFYLSAAKISDCLSILECYFDKSELLGVISYLKSTYPDD